MDKRKGCETVSTPPPRNKGMDSVILFQVSFLLQSQSHQGQDCAGAQGEVNGQAKVPEGASTGPACEAAKLCPTASYLTRWFPGIL